MSRRCARQWGFAGVVLVLVAGLAWADEPPPVNQLEGVVVSQDGGQPVAGVPVGLVHAKKGYLIFAGEGLMTQAEQETLFGLFPKRNGRYACQTVTDATGRFVLRNFAAPDELWLIAAGDAEHGYVLQTNLTPKDAAAQPLRLQLLKPAYLEASTAKAPKSMQVRTGVGLADPVAASDANADQSAEPAADAGALSERVLFYSAATLLSESASQPQRVGPLPGGQRYKVSVQGSSSSLPYPAVLSERVVAVAPGETAKVALQSGAGLTVTGRVISSEDKPLAKVNVKVRTSDGTLVGTVSDDDGKYELHGVPAGTHTLELLRHAKRTVSG